MGTALVPPKRSGRQWRRCPAGIGKMGNVYPGSPVKWTFNGAAGVVRFELGECQGLLMPVRPTPKVPETHDGDGSAVES
jgi:hypothetical protein